MIILPEIETVVIQPPRTGSSSLLAALLAAYPTAINPYRHMERVGIPKEFCGYDVVGIIRHPMERLWSLYKYMKWHPGKGHSATSGDKAWIRRVRKDADRSFEAWLLNSTDPFSDINEDGSCPESYHSTAFPIPATKKSQWEWLRPDMGPVEILKLEDGKIGERFGVELPELNGSKKMTRPLPSTLNMLAHVAEYHRWDLEQYDD